jgi:hypothetical protein
VKHLYLKPGANCYIYLSVLRNLVVLLTHESQHNRKNVKQHADNGICCTSRHILQNSAGVVHEAPYMESVLSIILHIAIQNDFLTDGRGNEFATHQTMIVSAEKAYIRIKEHGKKRGPIVWQ